ncbi:MAG: hypothetical protein ACT4OT_14220 [Acidobacteriota bacterium]
MSRTALAACAAFLALSSMLVPYGGSRGTAATTATFQQPSVAGTWRWEGTDKKLVLTQQVGQLKGRIEYQNGPIRNVEGAVAADGSVKLTELFPRSAAGDMPDSVWQEVLKQKQAPGHPGFLAGRIDLETTEDDSNELHGERTTFNVNWKRSGGEFKSLSEETEDVTLTRMIGTCGPDVTAQTLTVLREMGDKFVKAPAPTQDDACSALVSLDTAEAAWDILELFVDSGKYPKDKDSGLPSRWERFTAAACCTPRFPCGKSVEFFGECHDMHVVNYTMWGMTKALCSQYLTVNLRQWLGEWGRNRRSPNRQDQIMLTKVGEAYGQTILPLLKEGERLEKLLRQYDALLQKRRLGTASKEEVERFEGSLSPADLAIVTKFENYANTTDPSRFSDLKTIVAQHQKKRAEDMPNLVSVPDKRESRLCATDCTKKLSALQKAYMSNLKFNYVWVGLTKKAPPQTLKPK